MLSAVNEESGILLKVKCLCKRKKRDDLSLGAYVLLKATNMESRCYQCNRPRYTHVSIYYGAGTYIKISSDSKLVFGNEGWLVGSLQQQISCEKQNSES